MKPKILLVFSTLLLGGCIHLDAKPLDFTCGEMLAAHSETYVSTPLFREIQRDAGSDDCPVTSDGTRTCSSTEGHVLIESAVADDDPIVSSLERRHPSREGPSRLQDSPGRRRPNSLLLLSGGGSWGAFGAGYLQALAREDWTVVTGISTGALQGLFVAAGDYDALAQAYSIGDGTDLAKSNGLRGLIFKGSEYSIAPLHRKLMDYLVPRDGSVSPLIRMLQPGHPELSLAMVEARTGELKAVHITALLRSTIGPGSNPDPARLNKVARCVAGVALASSSIPVRLTPVRIDGHTYMDGGVRSSVFDAAIAKRVATYASRLADVADAPHVFVVRNGPTVVFRDIEDPDHPGMAAVDARPDIMRVGKRGYSTIVNQNELMSIAALRLNYPRGPISVVTADGFNAPMNPAPCGPRPEALFHAGFMRCLIAWGRHKSMVGPGWIELGPLPSALAPQAELTPR